jgi:hypothetical protein
MPNHISSLWSSPRRSARHVEGAIEFFARRASIALPLLVSVTVSACGGEEDDSVTYDDDVQVLFAQRCTTCHHAGSPINVDIQNPYNPETGLVFASNTWAEAWPADYAGLNGRYTENVVPGNPDSSFLMAKLTGDSDAIPNDHGGEPMPLRIPPLTEEQIGLVETWITNGAQNDAYFMANVQPIFGSEANDELFLGGKCVFCHYEDSASPGLDLTNPFGPNGLVQVAAVYRGDTVRVVPGDPDASFLMEKLRATEANAVHGAPMPYSFELLTERQIGTVRQWILEGALP